MVGPPLLNQWQSTPTNPIGVRAVREFGMHCATKVSRISVTRLEMLLIAAEDEILRRPWPRVTFGKSQHVLPLTR